MNQPENKQPLVGEQYLAEQRGLLQDAVEAITGDRTLDPLDVFPKPTPVRQDAVMPDLTEQEEELLRAAGAEFGMGGIEDVPSNAHHRLMEGGLAWKMAAEVEASEPSKTFIFAASPLRKVNDKEKEFMTGLIGDTEVGETEYDIARQIAEAQPGFEPLEQDIVLPFGYEVAPGCAVVEKQTGQLIQIGENNGRAVVLLRVDQDSPKPPFFRPNGGDLMGFVADVLTATGDEDSSIGIVTTNTYPSRAIDAIRAGLAHEGRGFDIGMVGRETMGRVKGEPTQPALLNQISGELHVIAQKLDELQASIE